MMKRKRAQVLGGVTLGMALLFLPGCSGSSAPAPTGSQPPAASGQAPGDEACTVADASGETKNAELQAVASEVFDSLQCGTDEPLQDQLRAAAKTDSVKQGAKAADATLAVDSAAGGTVMKLVAGSSGCTVTVLDGTDNKMLVCADL